MNAMTISANPLCNKAQKAASILIIIEDMLTIIAAQHGMV